MYVCFSHASGTNIIITSGSDLPVESRSSTAISIEQESDFPGRIIGSIFLISSPKNSLSRSSSLVSILLKFPR